MLVMNAVSKCNGMGYASDECSVTEWVKPVMNAV